MTASASASASATARHAGRMEAFLSHRLFSLLPGLLLTGLLAAVSVTFGRIGWLQDHGFSALTIAIVLGMLVGNTIYGRVAAVSGAGVAFSKAKLLRLGIVLYGLRLTVQDIGQVGLNGVAIDLLVVTSTFALACWIGTRWLGMDRTTVMLIGTGSAICGAAAVMGAEPVMRARAEQVTVAVATVVVFGTLGMFLYPVLFNLNQHWPIIPGDVDSFGIYIGSTIHEVAQVVAAARSIGPDAADAAIIAKMVRVMMLAPFLIILSAWLARDAARRQRHSAADGLTGANVQMRRGHNKTKLAVPWFAFGFVLVVMFNSLSLLPAKASTLITDIDTALLAMAMAALGLTTHFSSVRKAGSRPLVLACILFGWLVVGGALINRWMG